MMAQRSVPAPFLTKTYHLVDDPASDDVISWNEAGTSFVVWKTAEFAKELLPIYFKHNNFSSFVRQLNTYGFRKTVAEKWEFANENFKRGQKELLAQIQRRRNGKGDDLGSTSTSTSSPDSKNPAAGSPDSFSEAVRDDQTRQVMIGDEEEKCMKLFGVVVKKRGRGWGCSDNDGPNKKRNVAWMESNKVCN